MNEVERKGWIGGGGIVIKWLGTAYQATIIVEY